MRELSAVPTGLICVMYYDERDWVVLVNWIVMVIESFFT